jgi:hypothetical protein
MSSGMTGSGAGLGGGAVRALAFSRACAAGNIAGATREILGAVSPHLQKFK